MLLLLLLLLLPLQTRARALGALVPCAVGERQQTELACEDYDGEREGKGARHAIKRQKREGVGERGELPAESLIADSKACSKHGSLGSRSGPHSSSLLRLLLLVWPACHGSSAPCSPDPVLPPSLLLPSPPLLLALFAACPDSRAHPTACALTRVPQRRWRPRRRGKWRICMCM